MIPEELMQRLQALKNMTIDRGCTPAEAGAAAAYLQKLLAQHQLSMEDVKPDGGKGGEKVVSEEYQHGFTRAPAHYLQYATDTGIAFGCQVISNRRRVAFIGVESDAKVASHFFDVTYPQVIAEGRRQGRLLGYSGPDLRTFVASFTVACGLEVAKRLKEERQSMMREDARYGALVPLKKQKVDDYVTEHFPLLKQTECARIKNVDALVAGVRFGKTIPLTKGVEGRTGTNKLEGAK